MRIAIFSESFPPIINGVSVSIAILQREMENRGHQVFAFAPAYSGYVDSSDSVYRFPSKVTSVAPDYPLPLPLPGRLKEKFLDLKIDIVHTQTPFLLGMYGLKWARTAKVPIVSTNHTLYPQYAHYMPVLPLQLTQAATVWHMKHYYENCDGVICPSRMVKGILQGYGVQKEIEVIQTGISAMPQKQSREELRNQWGVPLDVPLLLYVGRVAREKNLDMLLNAFEKIKQRIPETMLMIVGGGPVFQELKERVKTEESKGIVLTGMLLRDEIWDLYRAADLFVFPSVTETQGLVICEALSAGLPAVVVNGGGAPEAVDDGEDGFIVPNDAEVFADTAANLLADDERRKHMSQAALEISRRFSTGNMAERIERYYDSIIMRWKG